MYSRRFLKNIIFQGQAIGGYYQNRSGGNYRPSHGRSYGNFDSMGHPKHFGGSGGGYQQGGTGIAAPFPHYSRQVALYHYSALPFYQ